MEWLEWVGVAWLEEDQQRQNPSSAVGMRMSRCRVFSDHLQEEYDLLVEM